jgi:hypothetical protein
LDRSSRAALALRYQLEGTLDRQALLRALDSIVADDALLRSVFPWMVRDTPAKVLPEDVGFALREHDLGDSGAWRGANPHADARRELLALIREESSLPFELARGPLARGRLVELRRTEHVLLMTLHARVRGDWSSSSMEQALACRYDARRGCAYAPLHARPVSLLALATPTVVRPEPRHEAWSPAPSSPVQHLPVAAGL